jgi:hypothetical protein
MAGPFSFRLIRELTQITAQRLNVKEVSVSPFFVFHHSPYSVSAHGSLEGTQWDYYTLGIDIVFTGHVMCMKGSKRRRKKGSTTSLTGWVADQYTDAILLHFLPNCFLSSVIAVTWCG